jgi:hypothetical protein
MKRTSLNFVIDALAFVAFLCLLSTGMVLQYQLPPGSGGRQGFGTGHGASDRPVELLWGWTRHEWGQVHYWIAFVLMAVLTVHLFLHWRWIVGVVRGKPSDASPYRLVLGCVGLITVIFLTAIPLATTTATVSRGELQEHPQLWQVQESNDSSVDRATKREAAQEGDENSEVLRSIRGSMTLDEIARLSGTPVSRIVQTLGLPADTDPNDKAGRLLREHGLQMSDLRQALQQLDAEDTPARAAKRL